MIGMRHFVGLRIRDRKVPKDSLALNATLQVGGARIWPAYGEPTNGPMMWLAPAEGASTSGPTPLVRLAVTKTAEGRYLYSGQLVCHPT